MLDGPSIQFSQRVTNPLESKDLWALFPINSRSRQKTSTKKHKKFPQPKNQGKLRGQTRYTNLLEQQYQRTQLSAQCTDQRPRLYNTKDRFTE